MGGSQEYALKPIISNIVKAKSYLFESIFLTVELSLETLEENSCVNILQKIEYALQEYRTKTK